MEYAWRDLNHQSAGTVVEFVIEGDAPNVRLLDSSNYRLYKAGRDYRFHGGIAKVSPTRLQVPSSGHWYAVVDYRGLRGRGKADVRVLSNV